MKSEVASIPQRGYPAEEKLREVIKTEEPEAVLKEVSKVGKEESMPKVQNGDFTKKDEKLRTPFGGAAAADTPPKESAAKDYSDRQEMRTPVTKSQATSASSPPAEQKLQEMPSKVAPANLKEDACMKTGSGAPRPAPSCDQSSASVAKEEKANKGLASSAAACEKKEEKLQEPVSAVEELSISMATGSSQPSDAASSPSCCSCF